jgi:chromosome segregation ATPase
VEIKSAVDTWHRFSLLTVVEVGKKLIEAKELIGHGGWLDYLEKTIGFSERNAQRYMKIYKEYGSGLNTKILSDLSYTNAARLLQLPEEDKKELLSDIESGAVAPEDVASEIEKYKARIDELEDLETENLDLIEERSRLHIEVDELKEKLEAAKDRDLSVDVASKEAEIANLKEKLMAAQFKEKNAKAAADAAAQDKIRKAVADAKKELEEKAATASAEELDKLKADLASAESRAVDAEKKCALSSSTALAEMSIILRNIVSEVDAAARLITAADEETAPKWRKAVWSALSDAADKIGETAGDEPPADSVA